MSGILNPHRKTKTDFDKKFGNLRTVCKAE